MVMVELAAGLRAVYDERVEFGARGVYGRGQAGGAGAYYDYFAVQSLFRHVLCFKPLEKGLSVSGITRAAVLSR